MEDRDRMLSKTIANLHNQVSGIKELSEIMFEWIMTTANHAETMNIDRLAFIADSLQDKAENIEAAVFSFEWAAGGAPDPGEDTTEQHETLQ
ncbi:MAG: hypothetical protein HN416_15355 [Nitrospina sp.]|jgi:hypothetical protein|nr:hypothetical protein [Nitrospina sp.]